MDQITVNNNINMTNSEILKVLRFPVLDTKNTTDILILIYVYKFIFINNTLIYNEAKTKNIIAKRDLFTILNVFCTNPFLDH